MIHGMPGTLAFIATLMIATAASADEHYLLGGYMEGTTLFGSPESKPSSAAAVLGVTSDDRLLGGRLEVELQVMDEWIGTGVGVRWDLGRGWHAGLGTGGGVLNADLDWQSDGLNFLLQGGIGRSWNGWRADLRLHHVSNASLRQPNSGTNGVLFLVGRTW